MALFNYTANTKAVPDNDVTLDDAVNIFGETFAANSTVILQLAEANSNMNENLSRNINNLQQQMALMNMDLQNLALAGHSGAPAQPAVLVPAQQVPPQAFNQQPPNWNTTRYQPQQGLAFQPQQPHYRRRRGCGSGGRSG